MICWLDSQYIYITLRDWGGTLQIPANPQTRPFLKLKLSRSACASVLPSLNPHSNVPCVFFFSPKPKVQHNFVFIIISMFLLFLAVSISVILSLCLVHSCIVCMRIFGISFRDHDFLVPFDWSLNWAQRKLLNFPNMTDISTSDKLPPDLVLSSVTLFGIFISVACGV